MTLARCYMKRSPTISISTVYANLGLINRLRFENFETTKFITNLNG